MKFSHPEMLYLMWAVVLVLVVVGYGTGKRKRILGKFAASTMHGTILPRFSSRRRTVKSGFVLVAMVFVVIALAGPLAGFKWEKVQQKGVDVMIALDCSRSMLASDIKPTRLERAKREIFDLLQMMKSDRAGLVAFEGDALLQCPLTLDHRAFNIFLKALDPDFLPMGGTNISAAIETALNGFDDTVDTDKAIILITDGESTSGAPVAVAGKAAEQGVKVFCVGVGSREGAPVPDSQGGFIKDGAGNIRLSRVDDAGLKKIAAAGNGIYVKSTAGDMDLDRIYTDNIGKTMEKKTLESRRRKVWEDRFQWFLFPAVVLLLTELFVANTRRSTSGKTAAGAAETTGQGAAGTGKKGLAAVLAAVLLLTGLVFPPECYAMASSSVKKGIDAYDRKNYEKAEKHFIDAQLERPDMPELYYNIGSAAYKKGDYKAALENFLKACETDREKLKTDALYNLGNTRFRLGKLKEAVKEYEKVIENNPDHLNARENLDFVKKKMAQRKKEQDQGGKQDRQKEQDQGEKQHREKEQNPQNQKEDPEQQKQGDGQKNEPSRGQENRRKDQNPGQEQNRKKPSGSRPGEKDKSGKVPSENPRQSEQRKKHPVDRGEEQAGQAARARQEKRAGQRLLNRLEDRPGRAMMPAYGEYKVEKDW
ncbi:MAG TPA: VWA domain-containing protein [Desulfobacteraceae bacterium]|nr:VWA domain-containing protein [Desulfobacteraceae bacterium]